MIRSTFKAKGYFNKYFTVENIVKNRDDLITDTVYFDIVVRLNISAFKKEYPLLAAQIRKIEDTFDYHLSLTDEQKRPILRIAFDSDGYKIAVQFKTHGGLFLSVTDENIEQEAVMDLTRLGHKKLYLIQNIGIELAGLKINVEELKTDLIYYYDAKITNLTFEFKEAPKSVSVKGLALGFFPIWLVDLFIPSNVADMTQEFFNTLISGNNGYGSYLKIGSIPNSKSTYHFQIKSDAEVMSNGTLQLAFNLQRNLFREKEKLIEELRRFTQQIWKAFYLDFKRIKSLIRRDNS